MANEIQFLRENVIVARKQQEKKTLFLDNLKWSVRIIIISTDMFNLNKEKLFHC